MPRVLTIVVPEDACYLAARRRRQRTAESSLQFKREVQPYDIPTSWLFGASTNLMGRFHPRVEQILLPAGRLEGGSLLARVGDEVGRSDTEQAPGKKELIGFALNKLRAAREDLPSGRFGIELRRLAPSNWSHTLNHHLLQSLLVRKYLQQSGNHAPVVAILPASIPGYIRQVYELFGFETLATNCTVHGLICDFWEEPFSCHRAEMVQLVRELVHDTPLGPDLLPASPDLPQKVFVSRRGPRSLTNEAEIESLLSRQGFQKVYPEDLTARQQFSLFAQATDIVAIHGAGIAPLAYRPCDRPGRFVELLTPGHMTDFFRFVAHQVGVPWTGVRGRLWPALVAEAYDFERPFKRHSLTPFSVDPESLLAALEQSGSS